MWKTNHSRHAHTNTGRSADLTNFWHWATCAKSQKFKIFASFPVLWSLRSCTKFMTTWRSMLACNDKKGKNNETDESAKGWFYRRYISVQIWGTILSRGLGFHRKQVHVQHGFWLRDSQHIHVRTSKEKISEEHEEQTMESQKPTDVNMFNVCAQVE